jgi:hypothetical protein
VTRRIIESTGAIAIQAGISALDLGKIDSKGYQNEIKQ